MKRRSSADVVDIFIGSDSQDDSDIANSNSDSDFDPESCDGESSNLDADSDDSSDVSTIVPAPASAGTLPSDWVDTVGTVPSLPAFTGRVVVFVQTDDFTPLDYWKLYVNDDLINHIVF